MRPPPAASLQKWLGGPSPTSDARGGPGAHSGVLAGSHLTVAVGGVPTGTAQAARSRLEHRPRPVCSWLRPRCLLPLRSRLPRGRRQPVRGRNRWPDGCGPGARRGAGWRWWWWWRRQRRPRGRPPTPAPRPPTAATAPAAACPPPPPQPKATAASNPAAAAATATAAAAATPPAAAAAKRNRRNRYRRRRRHCCRRAAVLQSGPRRLCGARGDSASVHSETMGLSVQLPGLTALPKAQMSSRSAIAQYLCPCFLAHALEAIMLLPPVPMGSPSN
ncbi:uncharacterized protein WM277_011154 [Molossus nigricans]